MSKPSDERTTSDSLFQELHDEFQFTIDVAASDDNHKLPRYYTKQDSAFNHDWIRENCFMNPPYSNIGKWLAKAYYEVVHNEAIVVAVLRGDTSTKWFHTWIWDKEVHKPRPYTQLRLPDKRFKFGPYNTTPHFPTMIVVIKNELAR